MRRIAAGLIFALTMTACGGSSDSTSDPVDSSAPLDAGFAKTWSGDFSMTCTGVGTSFYPGVTATLTVSGNYLTALLACTPSGSTTVTATGSGRTATWTGSFSCPPTVQGSCYNLIFTRTSVTYTLNANGTLTATGVGSLAGCGISTDCTTSFSGT
jgi:hypothetical protein